MPNVQGNKKIEIQPNDNGINYEFEVTVCTASNSNDGFLAFGRSVTSVSVSGYAEDKSTPANDLFTGSPSVSANVVTVPMKYPSNSGAGRYTIRFILTLDNGSTKEFDFNRVEAGDL